MTTTSDQKADLSTRTCLTTTSCSFDRSYDLSSIGRQEIIIALPALRLTCLPAACPPATRRSSPIENNWIASVMKYYWQPAAPMKRRQAQLVDRLRGIILFSLAAASRTVRTHLSAVHSCIRSHFTPGGVEFFARPPPPPSQTLREGEKVF